MLKQLNSEIHELMFLFNTRFLFEKASHHFFLNQAIETHRIYLSKHLKSVVFLGYQNDPVANIYIEKTEPWIVVSLDVWVVRKEKQHFFFFLL